MVIDVNRSPAGKESAMICAAVERCAGIDVGKKWLSVCLMIGPLNGEPRTERQRFGVNMADLQQLRDWLAKKPSRMW
jgi:hypothetical protein